MLGGQRYAPAALPPGKTRYTLYRRLDGPQGRSRQVWKISPPQRFDPQTVQFVVSRRYSCPILMKLEFSSIKFHENSSSGSRDVPRERTDGQT